MNARWILHCLLIALAATMMISAPPAQFATAAQLPPNNTETCPKVARQIMFTCLAPSERGQIKTYMRSKSVDPSTIVARETSLELRSIVVVWCNLTEVQQHQCQYRRAQRIYYIFGEGNPSTPASDEPAFVWVSESQHGLSGSEAITIRRQGAVVTTRQNGGPEQTTNAYGPWFLELAVGDKRLAIEIISNEDVLALTRIALALVPWGTEGST